MSYTFILWSINDHDPLYLWKLWTANIFMFFESLIWIRIRYYKRIVPFFIIHVYKELWRTGSWIFIIFFNYWHYKQCSIPYYVGWRKKKKLRFPCSNWYTLLLKTTTITGKWWLVRHWLIRKGENVCHNMAAIIKTHLWIS